MGVSASRMAMRRGVRGMVWWGGVGWGGEGEYLRKSKGLLSYQQISWRFLDLWCLHPDAGFSASSVYLLVFRNRSRMSDESFPLWSTF